jgi:hypothetical protein
MRVVLVLLLSFAIPVAAKPPVQPAQPAPPAAPPVAEPEEEEALPPGMTAGPATVSVGPNAQLGVLEKDLFGDGNVARAMLEKGGNLVSNREQGILLSESGEVIFEFDDVGYVKDDDKDSLDADKMLSSLREGQEEANEELKTTQHRRWNGKYFEIWQCRYLNQIPLRDQQPALLVNWCELKIYRESDSQLLYHNSWITNHFLTPQIVLDVCRAGRTRWRTENENHNILKNRGYHLEHNFGHGKQHLASVLLTLNLLAFLFHTVLGLLDERYQKIRIQRGTRKGFFQDILSLTKYPLKAG